MSGSFDVRGALRIAGIHVQWLLCVACVGLFPSVSRAAPLLDVDFETYPGGGATTIGDGISTGTYNAAGISYFDTVDDSFTSQQPRIVDGTTYGMSGHAVASIVSPGQHVSLFLGFNYSIPTIKVRLAATVSGNYEITGWDSGRQSGLPFDVDSALDDIDRRHHHGQRRHRLARDPRRQCPWRAAHHG